VDRRTTMNSAGAVVGFLLAFFCLGAVGRLSELEKKGKLATLEGTGDR